METGITDEIVKKAQGAYWSTPRDDDGYTAMRAALEAVVPGLIAKELRYWGDPNFDMVGVLSLRRRADELDPK